MADAASTRFGSGWAGDVRYGLRQLRKAPVFAATAILTLALGIGANTAIFTLIHGILLRSLPVSNPAALYRIGDADNCCVEGGFVEDSGDFDIVSYDLYLQLKASAPEFESLAAVDAAIPQWSVRRGATVSKPLQGEFVSGNYFSTLGITPFAGRVLDGNDDQTAAPPVAVLSYNAWQGTFAADRGVIGSTVTIQAHPFTVIGVAPPGFFGDRVIDTPPDLWVALAAEPLVNDEPADGSLLHQADSHWLYPIGRVRPGTNIPVLQQKLSGALRNWLSGRKAYTENGGAAVIPKQHVVIVPAGGGIQSLQQQTHAGLTMLMILAGVVLLIACANIGNILLARGTARRTETAVRMALGEARARLIRRTLTESALLSCLGGLAVAYGAPRAILALAFPDATQLPVDPRPDGVVLGFAFLVSLATGLLFGLAPAWLATRAQPAEALRGVNRSSPDGSALPQRALVVLQAALSMVLLAGALLLTRSLGNLENQPFGVATADRYVVHFDPQGAGYTPERLPGLYQRIADGFAAQPEVAGLGLGMYSPLEGDNWGECVIQEGPPAPGPNDKCGATWVRVSPGFLDAIGVPVVRGRGITAQDTAASTPVALVNQTFVKRFFPNQDPIGKRFGIDDVQYSSAFQIVGVFRDFKMNNPRKDVRPTFLRPLAQPFTGYKSADMTRVEQESMYMRALLVRFRRPPAAADTLMRHTLADVDPNLTVLDLRSFGAQVADNFVQDRLVARLAALFGILALLLAAVGLYGVTAYLVARRTGEIGIRMALGASPSGVMGLVLRGVFLQIGLGLALGIPAAVFTGRLMAGQIYNVSAWDAPALGGAAAALCACALAAGFIPARRAASVDMMSILRAE